MIEKQPLKPGRRRHITGSFAFLEHRFLRGYFWIFPTGPSSANIGCGTFQHLIESQRIDLRQLMQDFFTHHPVAKGKLGRATLSGTLKGGKIPLAIDHNSSRVRSGFMMAGDAASFTDPITAEGISYAMRSGILAAEAGIAALEAHDISWVFPTRLKVRAGTSLFI